MYFSIKVAIMALTALISVLALSNCSKKEHIRFIVPTGFRGIVTIAERADGAVPQRDANSAWVFDIPNDGKLIVADASPFEGWHTEEARYSDGIMLPVYQADPDKLSSQQVMFFALEVHGERVWYFFVGTESEFRNALTSARPAVRDDKSSNP